MLYVQFFALARQLVGQSSIELSWADGQTVRQLKMLLADQHPRLAPIIPQLLVAINNEYAMEEAPIKASDEVACFPPVSGG